MTVEHAAAQQRGRPLHRGLAIFAVFVAIQLLVVAAVAAWAAAGAREELDAARRDAAEGRRAVRALDLPAAEAAFADAQAHFERATADLGNPAVRALAVMPVIGGDVRTMQALAVSGGVVAEGATDILSFVNGQPDGVQAFLPSDGRFPVDRLSALAAATGTASQRLADAAATVAATPETGLVAPVGQARTAFIEELTRARSLVDAAAGVSGALATFMGEDGPRKYLFGAQNPAELRGTGGFIGAYAVATFEDGQLQLSRFVPVQQLTSLPVSEVPPPSVDFAARYNRYGGAGFWQAINASPDFPSVAESMVRLYERTEDVVLDGVIVVDPFALEALLGVVGDVRIPQFGRVGPDEVVPVVSIQARDRFASGEARKEILGSVAASALRRLLAGEASLDLEALLDTLAPMLEDRHLLLYSTDPSVQTALDDLGFTGALPEPDEDAVAVTVNNAAVNKIDFYVDRTVDYRVQLREDGSATARLSVRFHNRAPADAPADVLGPNAQGLEAGDNRSLVSVFCGRCQPTGAKPRLTASGVRSGTVIEQEQGHTVATTLLTVPQGTERTMQVDWSLDDAWSPDGDGCYNLTYSDQPTIRPTRLRVRVQAPDGYRRRDAASDVADGSMLPAGPVAGTVHSRTCYVSADDA